MTKTKWFNEDGTRMLCLVDGCDRVVAFLGRCKAHYAKARTEDGLKAPTWNNPDGSRKSCTSSGCEKPIACRGLCSAHYQQIIKTEKPKRKRLGRWDNPDGSRRACSEVGCVEPIATKGLCNAHYHRQWKRSKGLVSDNPKRQCPVGNCGKPMSNVAVICGACNRTRWRYGISAEAYIQMNLPENRVCGNPECGSRERLHIDHDHSCCRSSDFKGDVSSCGECVRGWLCRGCNLALGYLRENPRVIRGLASYVEGF